MQVSAINNQTNPKFNAKIKFVQNGANNLITQPSMDILTKKAQLIGKKSDVITIYLSQKISERYASLQEDTFKQYTNISGEFGSESSFCYPYVAEIGNVYGDVNNRQNKSFVLVEHFIDNINKALKG